jgi:hypothetical protein
VHECLGLGLRVTKWEMMLMGWACSRIDLH